jgi:hypothetical protein
MFFYKEEWDMKDAKEKKGIDMLARIKALGYESVSEWVRNNEGRIHLSFETARRAILEERENIRHDYLVRILEGLEFTPQEIAEELKLRGDKHLYKLVVESQSGLVLSSHERRLINKLRMSNNPKLLDVCMSIVQLQEKKPKEEEEE